MQAFKQATGQAKAAMSTHFSSQAAPGSSPSARPTHPTASPQLTPRTEKEQVAIPSLEPSRTGTAAPAAPQPGPPPARKPQSKTPTIDDRNPGGYGLLPQSQAQAQPQVQPPAQSPPQPPPGLPHPPSAFPAQLRPQQPPSGPDPRRSIDSSGPRVSRPSPDGRSTGHESNNYQREGESRQYEVVDTSLHKREKQLEKRQAAVMSLLAELKQREDNLTSLEERVRYLESEPYRQEVLSIRKHMQVNDMQEVSTITDKFRRITRKVEDISRDLGERLCDFQTNRELQGINLVTLLVNQSPNKQRGKISVLPCSMDPEDFIDFGCRALLNDWLVERICGPSIFHPALSRSNNDFYLDLYQKVRKQESQVIAGRWRVSTFNTIDPHGCNPQEIARGFCQHALSPLCDYVYKPEEYAEPIEAAFEAIKDLFKSALEWTYLSKTSVVMLDFQPGFFSPGSPFDQHYAQLEGPGKRLPGSEGILLTSKLGLISYRAQGSQGEDHTVQIPAKVLTAQYFL